MIHLRPTTHPRISKINPQVPKRLFRDQIPAEIVIAVHKLAMRPRCLDSERLKPREIKSVDKSQWYAEAEWAEGTMEEIGQF
jgi:hypothetical protein